MKRPRDFAALLLYFLQRIGVPIFLGVHISRVMRLPCGNRGRGDHDALDGRARYIVTKSNAEAFRSV
jgi:hypothetical protein